MIFNDIQRLDLPLSTITPSLIPSSIWCLPHSVSTPQWQYERERRFSINICDICSRCVLRSPDGSEFSLKQIREEKQKTNSYTFHLKGGVKMKNRSIYYVTIQNGKHNPIKTLESKANFRFHWSVFYFR